MTADPTPQRVLEVRRRSGELMVVREPGGYFPAAPGSDLEAAPAPRDPVAPEQITAPDPARVAGARLVDVVEALGGTASYRQLDYWLRTWPAVLLDHDPVACARPGYGHQRRFLPVEVARLERMATYVRAGMRPDAAARLARDGDPAAADAALAVAWATSRGECT